MPTRKIVCTYCGKEGKIDVWGLNEGIESSALFRYLGHNPLSGHMHFQCPFCEVVSLISPMSVLGHDILTADHRPYREPRNLWTRMFTAREDHVIHPVFKRPLVN
jgi:hypothetical protein